MEIKNIAYLVSGILGLLFLSGVLIFNHGLPEYIGFVETYFALFVIAFSFSKAVGLKKRNE
ncbi:hypothetical protein ASL83_003496 [Vibrio parahaemolyticus]|nr:hypothetical protein [Vibrio parahaemolyticus]EJO2025542.1 hypothetical protein [Vibrio parahaemolyticus]ELA8176485.1 hypothetical protein [Vibrio alginolyticus]